MSFSETSRTTSRSSDNGIQIEQRHTELVGRGDCDLTRVPELVGDEVGDERATLLLGGLQGLVQGILGHYAVLHESAR